MNWKQAIHRHWDAARTTLVSNVHSLRPTSEWHVTRPVGTCAPGGKPTTEVDHLSRARAWRRRVLLKRGVRLHASMVTLTEQCSVAMLDEMGVVVCWYGNPDGHDRPAKEVIGRHIAQFYVAQDLATDQPLRDLREAVVNGVSTRQGWRRRADDTAMWSTTVIEAVTLRDGRLQGFSYLTRQSEGPSDHMGIAQSLDVVPEHRHAQMSGLHDSLLHRRQRVESVSAHARQRRVFRLVTRGMHS